MASITFHEYIEIFNQEKYILILVKNDLKKKIKFDSGNFPI